MLQDKALDVSFRDYPPLNCIFTCFAVFPSNYPALSWTLLNISLALLALFSSCSQEMEQEIRCWKYLKVNFLFC